MSIRTAWRRFGVLPLARRRWLRPTPQSRWLSSGGGDSREQARFTYFAPSHKQVDDANLLKLLSHGDLVPANPTAHDAAVLLATPHYARHVCDSAFVGNIARLLSRDARVDQFHILCAIVDHVAPASGDSEALQGISVVRGHLDYMLPGLWLPPPEGFQEEPEALSCLTFNLGRPSVTLPLAQTTFRNSRPSTLIASRFDLTQRSPKLGHAIEKPSQRVNLTLREPAKSVADLGLWAPLLPLTSPRYITESFGNIVRAISIDRKSVPASTELETAVTTMVNNMPASETPSGPIGVWAMVTHDKHETLEFGPDPDPIVQGEPLDLEQLQETSHYLERQHEFGTRLYQVLSGGGGWGSKKGLLSLDPERTFMFHSEEEVMAQFVKAMDGSGYAPPGSQIQFYTPARGSPKETSCALLGVVFGVPRSEQEAAEDPKETDSDYVVRDHFGALSSKGIYITGPVHEATSTAEESKISVPSSRIYIDAIEVEDDADGGVLGGMGTAAIGEGVAAALILP